MEITTPIETEEWGERYFQVTDPNGVVIQLVQWVDAPAPPSGAGQRPERAHAAGEPLAGRELAAQRPALLARGLRPGRGA